MLTEIKKAEKNVRLLSRLASERTAKRFRLCTAFFANEKALYDTDAVQSFLPLYDCLFPSCREHPRHYLDAEDVYLRFAAALLLSPIRPARYETVYYEFGEKEDASFDRLSLTLPIFDDENDFVVYSPANDTYQYGFYHYGKLREGEPMAICPSGRLLTRKDTQKEKRPRLVLAGDALAPFLLPYIAHHFDVCMHAPLENAFFLSRDLWRFSPDVFLILGGVSLLTSTVLFHALSSP